MEFADKNIKIATIKDPELKKNMNIVREIDIFKKEL